MKDGDFPQVTVDCIFLVKMISITLINKAISKYSTSLCRFCLGCALVTWSNF